MRAVVYKVFVKLEQNHGANYLWVLADVFDTNHEANQLVVYLSNQGFELMVRRDTFDVTAPDAGKE